MKIKIGAIEIEVNSMEELDQIVERYAGTLPALSDGAQTPSKTHLGFTPPAHATAVSDAVVLKRLVEAGMTGMPTKELGTILGRGGKATLAAAQEWAIRVGLVQDRSQQAIERCRIGTQRAARIIGGLQDVAKALLDHSKK